jgi:hypothetical protein
MTRSHFIVPQEEEVYPSATIFYTVNEDPTLVKRSAILERRVELYVRFIPESEKSYLLDRKIWAEDYQG